jgi:hypothetical protein
MLLVLIAITAVISVPLAGGQLTRLTGLQVQAIWAVLLCAAIQVLITSVVRGGDRSLHVVLHMGSYALVGWFLLANRKLIGMPLVALGVALNVVAISANGGVMPAAATALRIAGIDTSGGFANSDAVAHPHLLPLGDVIPIPGPWPIGNVMSIGDLLIVAGVLILLHVTCRSRLTRAGRGPGHLASATG